jgi:hypothetical protein
VSRSYWNESSVFFRLSEQDLRVALHGWLEPPPLLPESVVRHAINPFTRQPLEIRSRVPEQPLVGTPDAIRRPSLEHCPWVSAEGLPNDNLVELSEILLACSYEEANDHWGRYLAGPEDANDILQPVSAEFVGAVAALSVAGVHAHAEKWLAITEASDLSEGWASRLLERLNYFFGQEPSGRYYFWTSR